MYFHFVCTLTIDNSSHENRLIRKGNRTATTSVRLQVVGGSPPEVTIEPQEDSKVLTASTVRIKGSAESSDKFSTLQYSWSLTRGNLDLQEAASTGLGGAVLALKPYSLTPGAQYTFRLAASDGISSEDGYAEIDIAVASPPVGGFFEVTVDGHYAEAGKLVNGTALTSVFQFICKNWNADDLPLSYDFAYQDDPPSLDTDTRQETKLIPFPQASSKCKL